MSIRPLTETENERIFQTEILVDFEKSLHPSRVNPPVLIYVAGQGAAGKSTTIANTQQDVERQHGTALLLQRDLLREYFPGYRDQLKEYGPEGYKFSEKDTWKWYEKLKTEAINRRASLVVESTFRKTDDIIADVARFTKAGYDVEARVLAVHPAISSVATFMRYESEIQETGVGRAVDPKTHAESVRGLRSTVRALEEQGEIKSICIQDRSGVVLVETSPQIGERKASKVLCQAHQNLSLEAAKNVKNNWEQVEAMMESRGASPDEKKQVRLQKCQAMQQMQSQSQGRGIGGC